MEDRTVLSFFLFTNPNGGGWNTPGNWSVWNPTTQVFVATQALPGASDDAGIGGVPGVVINGLGTEINSVVCFSPLTIPVGTSQPNELKIDGNPPAVTPPGFPVSPDGSDFFGANVIDAGRIIANTSDPFNPTGVEFAGGAVIGPGDLNGNLDAGPGSSFTFTNTGEFAVGATLGPGSGSVVIAAPVAVDGDLQDNTMAMNVTPGVVLGGATSAALARSMSGPTSTGPAVPSVWPAASPMKQRATSTPAAPPPWILTRR